MAQTRASSPTGMSPLGRVASPDAVNEPLAANFSRQLVDAQVKDAGAKQERFANKYDAERMWRKILRNGWAKVLEPHESSGHSSSRRPLSQSQSLGAMDFDDDDDTPIFGWKRKYHVVSRGRRPGVYTNWYVAITIVQCTSLSAYYPQA